MTQQLSDTFKSLCTEFYDPDKPNSPEEAPVLYLMKQKNSMQPVFVRFIRFVRFI